MIEVKNLTKSFGDTEVLKGISTVLEKGKTNLVIGQSGAGKTVFFKCLLGIFKPTSGTILYDGVDESKDTFETKQKRRSQIGTVFQGSALFDFMTVEENVRFPLEMFTNMSRPEMDERVNTVLERVNLTNANPKYPSEISGGMKKRVAIARAIVNRPKYLFADEPNSGLDPHTSIVIDKLIHEITVEYNITTVINSHDMNSVLEIGENIIFLKDGKKAWQGNNKEILVTDQQDVVDFVYSSDLMKQVRSALIQKGDLNH